MYSNDKGKPSRDYRYKNRSFKVVLAYDTLLKVIYDERGGFVGLNGEDNTDEQLYKATVNKSNLTADGRVRSGMVFNDLGKALDHICEILLNVSKVKGQINSFMFNTNVGSWTSHRKASMKCDTYYYGHDGDYNESGW